MDFTILAVVLLIGVGVPIRNKLIRKYRDKKKQEDKTRDKIREDTILKNFPLFCPKCKSECLIDIEQLDLRLALWEYRRY